VLLYTEMMRCCYHMKEWRVYYVPHQGWSHCWFWVKDKDGKWVGSHEAASNFWTIRGGHHVMTQTLLLHHFFHLFIYSFFHLLCCMLSFFSLLLSHSLNIQPMKHHFAFLFFLLLLSSFLVSARLLQPPKGELYDMLYYIILYYIILYSILLYFMYLSFFTWCRWEGSGGPW